ncbi:17587_t:CDS:2, partial [Acaulospora morrowiae]
GICKQVSEELVPLLEVRKPRNVEGSLILEEEPVIPEFSSQDAKIN